MYSLVQSLIRANSVRRQFALKLNARVRDLRAIRTHALLHTRIWDPLVNLRQLPDCCDRLKSLSLRVDPCARTIRDE